MDHLLTIGAFAERCGLSAKQLRTYDAAGLFSPAAVDAQTGYRSYTERQLPTAALIAVLRNAAVPVAVIGEILRDPTGELLEAWAATLEEDHRRRLQAVAEARARLRPQQRAPLPTTEEGPLMTLHVGTALHRGSVRPHNQDHVLHAGSLVAVADGFGPRGEVASALALAECARALAHGASPADALAAANDAVCRAVGHDDDPAGDGACSGTTLTAVVRAATAAPVLIHVGDSQLWRLRTSTWTRWSQDHRLVAELVAAGQVGPAEAADHEQRFVLTRAVGIGGELHGQVASLDLRPGDRVLLCTDGLTTAVDEDQVAALVGSGADPQHSADALVDATLSAGGEDNVAVAVLHVAGAPEGP